LRKYVLTAAQLRSLGSGYGSARALATLCAGQVVKRRVLVDAVVTRAQRDPQRERDWLGAGLRLLIDVEARAPEVARAVLSYPFVDAWAVGCLRLMEEVDGGDSDRDALTPRLGYLAGP
jgi:HEXXH motif-containing protein